MNLLFKNTEKKVIIELFFATKILDLDAIIRRIHRETTDYNKTLFFNTIYSSNENVVKKKRTGRNFSFFLDNWKRRCFSPHPSLLTDIFDGNKRAKSSLCITSTHDFRDYGAVPLNGRGNSAIRSGRQTSSVSGYRLCCCITRDLAKDHSFSAGEEYNIRLIDDGGIQENLKMTKFLQFLKFLNPRGILNFPAIILIDLTTKLIS